MPKIEICGLVAVVVFASVVNFSQALKCYTCSSDIDPYCADPFNTTLMTASSWGGLTRHHVLQDCAAQTPPTSYLHQSKTVCRKTRQTVKDRETIIRACSWQSPDTAIGSCPSTNLASYIQIDFCETCDMDGCNSANAHGLAKHLLALVPAVLLAKFVRF